MNQNTDRDAETCGCAVTDAENRARNLDSLGEADVPMGMAKSTLHQRPMTAPRTRPPTMKARKMMLLLSAWLRGHSTVQIAAGLHSGLPRNLRPPSEMRKPAPEAGLGELRGKDSNLDYLIQSQASYH